MRVHATMRAQSLLAFSALVLALGCRSSSADGGDAEEDGREEGESDGADEADSGGVEPSEGPGSTTEPSKEPAGEDPEPADAAGPSGETTDPADPSDSSGDEPAVSVPAEPPRGTFPILFVTQVPVEGFVTSSSAFGNHRGTIGSAPRGGDLMVVYPDGTLRNLTREAGFGSEGEEQDEQAIAVREPTVHWNGEKAVFSMLIGAPPVQYEHVYPTWQLYEVTGLEAGEMATITKVAGQPEQYNNVAPLYATNGDDILFTSDRPPSGAEHHYPQLDEYESAATVTGIYRLSPDSGDLVLLEHAPSGAFSPTIDSFGRVIFTKWDHLQRDQQALPEYEPITYSDESSDATSTTEIEGSEVFPEARETEGSVSGHTFNHFFPWEMNEDGSAEETINHVGRHEFGGSYTEGSFMNDDNLSYYAPEEYRANRFSFGGDGGTFHIKEDPLEPGSYYATLAPEFYTAGGGRLVRFDGHPSLTAEEMVAEAVTAEDEGTFRSPLPLHDGRLVAVYTRSTDYAMVNYDEDPPTNYDYRLYELEGSGSSMRASAPLTDGISKRVTWWDPDARVTYDGPLWELDPVEVVARPAPEPRRSSLEEPEQNVLDAVGVDEAELQAWLRDNELALIVMRNVTLRDRADLNQPFNLRVPGGAETIATDGTVYDISHLQVFQAEAVRGYGNIEGRRLLPRPLRETPMAESGVAPGSTAIGEDGSVAAFVPARRALSWQLVSPEGEPVVRERNWLSFQAGEIRTCPVCHGLNNLSQLGTPTPENEPEALRTLLERWVAER